MIKKEVKFLAQNQKNSRVLGLGEKLDILIYESAGLFLTKMRLVDSSLVYKTEVFP